MQDVGDSRSVFLSSHGGKVLVNALTGEVKSCQNHFSGKPTYQDLRKPFGIIGASHRLNCEVLNGRRIRIGLTSEGIA